MHAISPKKEGPHAGAFCLEVVLVSREAYQVKRAPMAAVRGALDWKFW